MPDEQLKRKNDGGLSSTKPRCGAKLRTREGTCIKFPVNGTGKCRTHGGATPQAKNAYTRSKAEEAMRKTLSKLDVEPVKDPLTALSQLAGEIMSWKDTLAAHVGQLKTYGYAGEHGEQIRAEVQLYERALDRCVTVLDKIARLDIDSRLAAIGEKQAELVEQALAAGIRVLGLTVSDEQRVWQAVSDHLRTLPKAG